MGILNRPFRRSATRRRTVILLAAVGLIFLFWPPRPLRSDNFVFVFYLPTGHQIVPLRALDHTEYLSLLRVLNAVGAVSGLKESSNALTVYYGEATLKFRAGKKQIRAGDKTISLSEPVRVEEGQWLVPLDFLSKVLPQVLKEPVEYRSGSKRAFIGAVKPATYALHLTHLPEGTRLTVDFTEPVGLRTASRNGKWYIYLGSQPVQPLEHRTEFQSPYVSSIQFDDQDGEPKLIITPQVEGLDFYPTLAEGGKTIRADLLKSQPAAAQAHPPEQAPPQSAPPVVPPAPAAQPAPAFLEAPAVSNLPVVVLDAGHGGDNLGAEGAGGVLEKNLVAQLAVRTRLALLATGKYRVVLTRLGDTDPGFDQRDSAANSAHPVAFLSFHAGNMGFRTPQVAVYTYQPSLPAAPRADPPPLFRPWATLQESHLPASQKLAQDLQQQFSKVPGMAAARVAGAPVRVLRSVDAPAAAVELGSLAPGIDPEQLFSTPFQERLAEAIVAALEAFGTGGVQP